MEAINKAKLLEWLREQRDSVGDEKLEIYEKVSMEVSFGTFDLTPVDVDVKEIEDSLTKGHYNGECDYEIRQLFTNLADVQGQLEYWKGYAEEGLEQHETTIRDKARIQAELKRVSELFDVTLAENARLRDKIQQIDGQRMDLQYQFDQDRQCWHDVHEEMKRLLAEKEAEVKGLEEYIEMIERKGYV